MKTGIYKITNLSNNKIYIGQSIDIEKRWSQHISDSKNDLKSKSKIATALASEGLDNFLFEIIEECQQEKLNDKEIYWIAFYQSNKDEFGYNVTSGGTYGTIINRQDIYDLWDKGYTVGQIAESIPCSPTIVRSSLKGYKDYNPHNSRVRGGKSIPLEAYSHNGQVNNGKPIYQYTLLGEYVKEFPSAEAAARELNVPSGEPMSWAARGIRNTAYNFQWKFDKFDKIEPTETFNFIKCVETGKIYKTAREAALDVGLKSKTGIQLCCAKRQKTAGTLSDGTRLHWILLSEDDSN